MLFITLERQDKVKKNLSKNCARYSLYSKPEQETEQEPEPKRLRSRNQNRNISLRFQNTDGALIGSPGSGSRSKEIAQNLQIT